MSKNSKSRQAEDPSRRQFIKTSSALVAGGTFASSLSIARSAHAQGSAEIKVALVGCGGRGTGAASQALSTEGDVKLVAMADAFQDQVESCYNRLKENRRMADRIDVPEERRFSGFDAYQKAIDSGIDLVILATPPGFRPIHFDAAVKANKHVFMEKPVAVDAPGVRQVLATAKEAKQKNLGVGVGLQRHHQQAYIETIDRLQNGAIGDILLTRVYWNGAGVWVRPRKPDQTEMEYQMRNWYYFNWLCGDHICEQHIHNLDVSNWLKGGPPVSANGMGGREVRTGKEYGEIFDHHFVEFTYEDGSKMMSQCRHIPGCWNSVSEHAHGTKGTANISGGRIEGEDSWRFRGQSPNPYQVEHDDLFASIRNGTPLNEAEYGATSTMTSILGRMATYSGQEISWDDAINSEISLAPEKYAFDATAPVLPDDNGFYPVPVPGETKVI
ncbi:MAG: Gfo/Idh/MocA family oxidoreductase [Pirellulales bacterium]